jgi:hypothetical protein
VPISAVPISAVPISAVPIDARRTGVLPIGTVAARRAIGTVPARGTGAVPVLAGPIGVPAGRVPTLPVAPHAVPGQGVALVGPVAARGDQAPITAPATVPADTQPLRTRPIGAAPVDTVPVDTVPVDTALIDTVPIDTVPMAAPLLGTRLLGTRPLDAEPREVGPLRTGPAAVRSAPAPVPPIPAGGVPAVRIGTVRVGTRSTRVRPRDRRRVRSGHRAVGAVPRATRGRPVSRPPVLRDAGPVRLRTGGQRGRVRDGQPLRVAVDRRNRPWTRADAGSRRHRRRRTRRRGGHGG